MEEEEEDRQGPVRLRSLAASSFLPLCWIFERPLIGRIRCWGEHWEMRVLAQRRIAVVNMIVVFEGDLRGLLTGIAETS